MSDLYPYQRRILDVYRRLVNAEAQCLAVHATLTHRSRASPSDKEWQTWSSLHRSLLDEYYEIILVVDQVPTLRGRIIKFKMLGRMWKYGIHCFLEALLAQRNTAQEFLAGFLRFAYDMVTLLFETVPRYVDTWTEILGDLARYFMVSEESDRAIWREVGVTWYTMASDRAPAVGRLYHHLGVLEPLGLRKFSLYLKSLMCQHPFGLAEEPLQALCQLALANRGFTKIGNLESQILTLHARLYLGQEPAAVRAIMDTVLSNLCNLRSSSPHFASDLAMMNIFAIPFGGALATPSDVEEVDACALDSPRIEGLLNLKKVLWVEMCRSMLRRCNLDLQEGLEYLHVILVFVHGMLVLQNPLAQPEKWAFVENIPWGILGERLNHLAQRTCLHDYIRKCGREGTWYEIDPAHPLPEDYMLRGSSWSQSFFRLDWFDHSREQHRRAVETQHTRKHREDRVLWLGFFIAFHTEYLNYDAKSKKFSPGASGDAAEFNKPDVG